MCRVAALIVCLAGLVSAAAAVASDADPRLPPPTGRFQVGTVAWDTTLPAIPLPASDPRYCRITAQLWYPAEPGTGSGPAPYGPLTDSRPSADAALGAQVAAAQARYPILLFFPGWDGGSAAYTAMAQGLASHGFIVAVIGYDSADCALPNNEAGPTDMDFSSKAASERIVRIADAKITRVAASATRVLDALAALDHDDRQGRFTGRLDLGRAAAIGHSLGGAIAVQLAWLDARIKSAIDIDGWLWDAAPGGWIGQPFLIIGSDAHAAASADPGATQPPPPDDYPAIIANETIRRLKAAAFRYGGVGVLIGDSYHEDFTDVPYLSRAAPYIEHRPDGHAIRIAVDCAVTFFGAAFSGDTSPTCQTSSMNVRIEIWHRPAPDASAK